MASLFVLGWFFTHPISNEAVRFFKEAVLSYRAFPFSFEIISLVSALIILLTLFYKKTFGIIAKAVLAIGFLSFFIFAILNLDYFINPWFFNFRTWPCIALPLIFLTVLAIDYFKVKINKCFYSNMLSILCITGIFYSLWQINQSYYFYKDYAYLKNRLKTVQQKIVIVDQIPDAYSIKGLKRYHTSVTFIAESILFSENYKVKTVVLPSADRPDFERQFDVLEDENRVQIPFVGIDIKNKFWDLTDVVKKYETK